MTDPELRAESPAAVLAIAVGLAIIVSAAYGLLGRGLEPVDGDARLAEVFEIHGDPPFGFAVTKAVRLADDEVMVLLSDPEGPPPEAELAPFVAAESAAPGPMGRDGKPRTDWTKVETGEPGSDPVQAAFVWYPKEIGEGVLEKQFVQTRFRDIKHLFGEKERVPVDAGHIDWGQYRARYVRSRYFHKEKGNPVFHDTVRVNLSRGQEACVLYVRWGRGLPGDVEGAKALLAVYLPR